MRQKWTSEEIDIIKSGFLAGKLVKTIAGEVGRTTTAVNKFLSRSGIRTRRWSIRKTENSLKLPSGTVQPIKNQPVRKKKKLQDFKVSDEVLNAVYKQQIVTNFRDVVRYLKANGYAISKNAQKAFAPMDDYAINDKPVSDVKLLILANRLRCEKNQPIFAVPELTWE